MTPIPYPLSASTPLAAFFASASREAVVDYILTHRGLATTMGVAEKVEVAKRLMKEKEATDEMKAPDNIIVTTILGGGTNQAGNTPERRAVLQWCQRAQEAAVVLLQSTLSDPAERAAILRGTTTPGKLPGIMKGITNSQLRAILSAALTSTI